MATGFDLAGLSAWTKENAEQFFSKAVLSGPTASLMTTLTGMKGKEKLPIIGSDYDILQSNDCDWDAKGGVAITQREIDVKRLQVQQEYCVSDLEAFFTRQILTPGSEYDNLTRMESMFIDHIIKSINKVVELIIWNGNTGGGGAIDSYDLMDGLLKIGAADIPAGQKKSGSNALADIVTTVEALRDALPIDNYMDTSEYLLFVGGESWTRYFRKYRADFTALPYNQQFEKVFIDGTGIRFVPTMALQGTNKMLLVAQPNLWLGTDIAGEQTSISLERGTGSERNKMFLSATFHLGVQIGIPGEAVSNGI